MRHIGVFPAGAANARPRLLQALEEAYPVRFEAREAGSWEGLDAAVSFAPLEGAPDGLPTLTLAEPSPGSAVFDLHDTDGLEPMLRGRSVRDATTDGGAGVAADDRAVLASRGRTVVWSARGSGEHAAAAPPELAADESLRDLLKPGRFFAALPLVCFLRRLTEGEGWTAPPLRAAFQLDDPNLHRPRYGHVRYAELVRDADEHDYHAAMAMIPLDAWYANRSAVRLFRERGDRISLLMHGNDHVLGEFTQERPEAERVELLAQAMRRIDAFERRTGLGVGRVMVAPHGDCSDPMMTAMARTGMEALCIEWPYWWRTSNEAPALLSGWEPGEFLVDGMPVLPRHPVQHETDEVLFRAFLGGPIVFTGHHDDLADGLALFRERAAFVNGLGDVRWTSLGEMAAGAAATRREGTTLRIRAFSRRLELDAPDWAEQAVLELPAAHGSHDLERVLVGRQSNGSAPPSSAVGEPFPVPASRRLELRLQRHDAVDPSTVPAPSLRAWPILRRVLAESRDRLSARL